MTTKPPWTDEEKFWRSIRQAMLGLVDAVETYRLGRHVDVRTSKARELLKAYRRAYPFPPVTHKSVQECIEELREEAGVLTTDPERGKL